MKNIKLIIAALMICAAVMIAACGSKEEPTSTEAATTAAPTTAAPSESATMPDVTIPSIPEDATVPETTEAAEVFPDGYMKSYLTGLPVPVEIGTLRPVGFQIDNEKKAMPQNGIAQAEVVYEVPIEAYEVRLTAIFQDMTNVGRIGPLRSARSYHPGILAEYDGIFFHNGHSDIALKYLNDERCDDIEAVDRDYNAKFATKDHTNGHNDFTNPKKTEDRIEYRGFRRELSDDFVYKFKFMRTDEQNMLEDGVTCNKMYTNYKQNNSYFVYDEDDGLYYRYAYGTAAIDEDNGKQVAVKNIIVQYCTWNLEWDKDTKNIHTTNNLSGWYITNGKAIRVNWEKDDYWDNTHYYTQDGEEIRLNAGQTWVCIVLDSLTGYVTIE